MNDVKFKQALNALINPLISAIDNIMDAKENITNKTTSLSNDSTDTEYPSAKATNDAIINATETMENRSNKVTEINSESTDKDYPSAAAVEKRVLPFVNQFNPAEHTTGVYRINSYMYDFNSYNTVNGIAVFALKGLRAQLLILSANSAAAVTAPMVINYERESINTNLWTVGSSYYLENTSAKEHTLTNSADNYPASDAVWAAIQAACYVDSEATV